MVDIPAARPVLQIPHTIFESSFIYHLDASIGQGRWSTVYRTEVISDLRQSQTVAVKVKQRDLKRESFVEGWIHAKLQHPNVVELHRAFSSQSEEFLVLELCQESLRAQLEKKPILALQDVSQLMAQILKALQYIHDQGFVHHDVKPDNIYLDMCGNAKLGDFSLAACLPSNGRLYNPCGTTRYMAPEILELAPEGYDEAVDVWSTGVVMAQTLFSRRDCQREKPTTRGDEAALSALSTMLRRAGKRWKPKNILKHVFFHDAS